MSNDDLNIALNEVKNRLITYLDSMGVDVEFNEVTGLRGLVSQIRNIEPTIIGVPISTSLTISCNLNRTYETGDTIVFTGGLSAGFDDTSSDDLDLVGFLKGASISFYDGNQLIGSVVTDNNGEYSFSYIIPSDATLSVKAVYTGSDDYDGSETQPISVDIVNNADSIVLSSSKSVLSYNDEDSCTLSVVVKDIDDEFVEGKTISFCLSDEYGLYDEVLTAKTDEFGECSVSYDSGNRNNVSVVATSNGVDSNTIVLEDCYYWDESSSNNVSNYTVGSGVSLSYNSDNSAYVVQKNSSNGNVAIINDNFTIFNNCVLSADFKIPSSNGDNLQPSIALFNENNGVRIRMVIAGNTKVFSIQEATKTSESSTNIDIEDVNLSYDEWYTIKYVLEGNIITGYLINNGEVISVVTGSTNSLSTTDNKLGLMYNYSANGYYYVKNIKVKELITIELSSDVDSLSYVDNDSCILTAKVFKNNSPVENKEVSFDIVDNNEDILYNIGTSVTDENGEASVTYQSQNFGDIRIKVSLEDIESNSLQIEDYTSKYSLDGTENIRRVTGTTIISDNVLRNGCGYLSDGWDNTGDWLVKGEGLFSDGNTAIILCVPTLSSRDSNWVQIIPSTINTWQNSSNTVSSTVSPTLSYNTWYSFNLEKKGSIIYVTINNNTYQTTLSTLNTSTACIGVDTWSSGSASLKNIKIMIPNKLNLSSDKTILSYVDEDECTLTATLTRNNSPATNKLISFDIIDKDTGEILENIGSDVTNSDGVASVNYVSTGRNDFYVRANYANVSSDELLIEDCYYADLGTPSDKLSNYVGVNGTLSLTTGVDGITATPSDVTTFYYPFIFDSDENWEYTTQISAFKTSNNYPYLTMAVLDNSNNSIETYYSWSSRVLSFYRPPNASSEIKESNITFQVGDKFTIRRVDGVTSVYYNDVFKWSNEYEYTSKIKLGHTFTSVAYPFAFKNVRIKKL